jgi:carbonic anhydrase/acetyltransferase-like protein (isoleucine patch superfamily)
MIRSFGGHTPTLHPNSFAAENATIVGEVAIEEEASIWYGAVLRGEAGSIRVGRQSCVEDNAVLHCGPETPLEIGRNVVIGHGAIVHGCRVEDGCLIGMGAILLSGCCIGAGSMVAAGSLVTEGKVIPPGSVVMGSPAKVVRRIQADETAFIDYGTKAYVELAAGQLPKTKNDPD